MIYPKKIKILALLVGFLLLFFTAAQAGYNKRYCDQSWVTCIKVKKGQSWQSMWPDPYERDLIKRFNRLNIPLQPGMTVAVPNNLNALDANDLAPFVRKVAAPGMKTILVSPSVLAWGAYDANGNLIKWGPISGGKDYCADIGEDCRSRTGVYYVYDKRGPGCISTKFPVEGGGAPMPYCMFYSGGYALHGSPQVPGYHASHGCIRLFNQDARWLNQDFVGKEKVQVIVLPYSDK